MTVSEPRQPTALVLVALMLGSALVCSTVFATDLMDLIGLRALYILHLFFQAGLFGLALSMPKARERLLAWKPVVVAIAAYSAVVLFSTAYHWFPGTARLLENLLIPSTIVAFVLCVPLIFRDENYERLFLWLVVTFACVSALSLALWALGATTFLGHALNPSHDGRGGKWAIEGLFGQRNIIGSYLAPLPALTAWLALRRGGFKPWHWVAIALLFAHLMLTFSRSSQVVAAIDLLPLLWLYTRGRRSIVLGIGVAGAAAFTALYFHMGQGFGLLGRDVFWRELFQILPGHWWLGYGLLNISFHGYTLHNVYLTQLGYFGVVGTIAFFAMMWVLARAIYLRARAARLPIDVQLLVAILVGALAQGMTEYFLTYPLMLANSFFWLVVGALLRMPLGRKS